MGEVFDKTRSLSEFFIDEAKKATKKFESDMARCDIYDALNSYRHILWNTEKAREYAYQLKGAPPEYSDTKRIGENLISEAWAVEHKSVEIASNLTLKCDCKPKPPG
jgi:hypothetical protein